MLALIKDGMIVQEVAEGAGFAHEEGTWTMPAEAGWERDGYTLTSVSEADPPPDGKSVVAQRVEMLNGTLRWVNIMEDNPPVRLSIPKSTVMQRLIERDKMDLAYQMLSAAPKLFARWFAPDHPAVYSDDPDATTFVLALGEDPAVILAP